jgi:hypothetical protein
MAFSGDFTPVLGKHAKHLRFMDASNVGPSECGGTSSQ